MADKNPKHPLKKKKVAQKTNILIQDGSDNGEFTPKSKKHVYE